MKKGDLIEKALYNWLNQVSAVEDAVISYVDGNKYKRELIPIISESKRLLIYMENLIKKY